MKYMTIKEASKKWDITVRRIQVLCSEGRIQGATRFGRAWAIPVDSEKPRDARIKSGKYIKKTIGMDTNKKLKLFSFFSGSGFLDLGFEKTGYDIELVNEFHQSFMEAYKYSREKMGMPKPKYGYFQTDINDFLYDRKDELMKYIEESRSDNANILIGFIGGPPCPDFSIAGKQKGKEGENGKLSLSYINLILEMQPDFFLFENVKGLWRTKRHREFYDELKKKLKRSYEITDRLTNSLEYGAPQDRDRILLFGVNKSTISSTYKGMLCIDSFHWEKYQTHDLDDVKQMPWPQMTPYEENSVYSFPDGIKKELTVEYWFRKNDVENHPNAHDFFTPRQGLPKMQSIDEGDDSKKSYKRLHRWRYSPTVAYGNNEVHLHPYKTRRLSAAESMALQSLPKEFCLPPDMSLSDKFKTIGNGVPFFLARGLAKTIKDFLENNN